MEGDLYFLSWAAGLSLAHAALPTHWLPFVLLGRARGWGSSRILGLLLLAGGGHVGATILLGLLAAFLGREAASCLGEQAHVFAALLLMLLGAFYALLGLREGTRSAPQSSHQHHSPGMDRATGTGLLLMLTLSPCEAILPVFVTAGSRGWETTFLLAVVMGVVTLGGMVLLALVALFGLRLFSFPWLERHERLVVGLLLLGMGLCVLLLG